MGKFGRLLLGLSVFAWRLAAQESLSLPQAVEMALRQNQGVAASEARVKGAEAHTRGAKAGYYPTVNYSESATRSNNPVFVFGSLLSQHQFTVDNFQIGPLNRPQALDNFRSAVTAQQTLFDGGQTKNEVRASEALRKTAETERALSKEDAICRTVSAYLDAVLAEAAVKAADESVKSAEADLERARNILTAGMSTDADVLSIRVHLARVRQQRIRRGTDVANARSALNDALGQALEAQYELTTGLGRAAVREDATLGDEPNQLRAQYAADLAAAQLAHGKSTLLPTVSMAAAFEADRQTFAARGGANWTVGATLNWNLFNGLRDKAQIEEARQTLLAAQAAKRAVSSGLQLRVRRAVAELHAADERIAVTEATVAEAEESLRITKNRYAAGLSPVADLLRTEAAVLEARTDYFASLHDQRMAAVQLDLAAGELTADAVSLKDLQK